ncbi:MAG: hypothetical protein KKG33_11660 [candidate division Zixibacteria bacterium]|nr:hypothetical protein [candidate division Zixibacteria bacterium]MBU1472104.1 hypothetical protein [candidate division Zixibacteria bacterium]MBU2626204.1 hypothetical protein [candidate division Zixibacteria bacterium]
MPDKEVNNEQEQTTTSTYFEHRNIHSNESEQSVWSFGGEPAVGTSE